MLEILKREVVHEENFKDLGESDILCPYEHLVWFCEMTYGKKETWDYIQSLFKGADRNTQLRLLKCISNRYDEDTDHQRRQILVDLACGDVLDKYVVSTAILSIHGEFDYIKPRMETYKDILWKLDRSKHENTFQYISTRIASSELFETCKTSSILTNIIIQNDWDNYEQVLKFVKTKVLNYVKKEDVISTFKLFLEHEYATEEAKQTVMKLLNEVMLK